MARRVPLLLLIALALMLAALLRAPAAEEPRRPVVLLDIDGAIGPAGSDYVASSLSGQSIPAGSLSKTFAVTINGDRVQEPDETFTVNVSGVSGATVSDGSAVGTIKNDDRR